MFVKEWTEGKMSDCSFHRPLSSEEEEEEGEGGGTLQCSGLESSLCLFFLASDVWELACSMGLGFKAGLKRSPAL